METGPYLDKISKNQKCDPLYCQEAYFKGLSQILAPEIELEFSFFDFEQFLKTKTFLGYSPNKMGKMHL